MFRSKTKVLIVTALLVSACTSVWAQSNSDKENARKDKARYQTLLREVREIDSEYAKVLTEAMEQTKNEGRASLEIKSRLISLEEKRSRKINHLLQISLRHGWEMPSTDIKDIGSAPIKSEKEQVFESADKIIQEKFAQEACKIAAKASLPVISLEPKKKERKERKVWFSL